jgi:hypothetical protein
MSNARMFCKFCLDAGKPESVYRSHCVKGAGNKVTCPTLLCLKCRYCNEAGHTVKYCRMIKSGDKVTDKVRTNKVTTDKVTTDKVTNKANVVEKPTNMFSLLDCDEDEEETKTTYAEILQTEAVEVVKLEIPKLVRNEPVKIERRWADYESDDDSVYEY